MVLLASLIAPATVLAADEADAAKALRRAVTFWRTQVGVQGGHVYRVSADLKLREGEGVASPTTVWVQPPGTPTIGQAYLEAYHLSEEEYLLEAARETAMALVRGQLRSGGWDYKIEFAPEARKQYAYRTDSASGTKNVSVLDDNTSQAALRFLMQLDRTLEFRDTSIHEACRFALDGLLAAQRKTGGWPQRFSGPAPAGLPVPEKASYPDTWSRTHPKQDYSQFYTFNDNAMADVINLLLDAAEIYREPKYRQAAERGGEFMLKAQMPAPQPAWAQQYNEQLQPAWARRFEPPSITGGESQGVMRALIELSRRTGETRFLKPIPSAIAYLRKSQQPDGKLARFYELQTNRPLYFTKTYELTYSADDLPTHYGFVIGSSLDQIEKEYAAARDGARLVDAALRKPQRAKPSKSLEQAARDVMAALDDRGAWITTDRLRYVAPDAPPQPVLDSRVFAKNVVTLARHVGSLKK